MFGNLSLFKIPFPGRSSIPTSFVSFFAFYIFSYLLSKTMSCFSGCLMSSAIIQKLFCGIYSVFKCSFDEFVGEKVVFPSYSSAILGPPPALLLNCISYLKESYQLTTSHLSQNTGITPSPHLPHVNEILQGLGQHCYT